MRSPSCATAALPRSLLPSRAPLAAAVALLAALLHLAALNPTPLAGDPRPPLRTVEQTDRFVAPHPVTSSAFATFPAQGPSGEAGLWLLPRTSVPLQFQVEREVIERFGRDRLDDAIEVFNDVPGSRFGAEVTGLVDERVDERRREGVNRIFLDRQGCGERYLARAHLWSDPVRVREGRAVRDVREVDIGLCDRLSTDAFPEVVRHELAHIAGLDHLCDPGDECHRPGMGDDNRCRIMHTRLHQCQQLEKGDLDGLVHLYPALPRVGGGDARSTAARATRVTHPVARGSLEAVVSSYEGPPARQILSAALAGHLGHPHVLVDADCTSGPDGQALNRVLALAGTVTAVGPIPDSCRTALEHAWGLEVEDLTSTDAVTSTMVDAIGGSPARLVVAPAPVGRDEPLAAMAAAAALRLQAPLVVLTEEGRTGPVLRALEEHPTIGEVVVVGAPGDEATPWLTLLSEVDVALRWIAGDATEVTETLGDLPALRRARPLGVAVMGEAHPEHAAASVSLAAAIEGLVLPVSSPPTPDHLQLLDERFTRGVVVGGLQAISSPTQRQLSRAVDGDW